MKERAKWECWPSLANTTEQINVQLSVPVGLHKIPVIDIPLDRRQNLLEFWNENVSIEGADEDPVEASDAS